MAVNSVTHPGNSSIPQNPFMKMPADTPSTPRTPSDMAGHQPQDAETTIPAARSQGGTFGPQNGTIGPSDEATMQPPPDVRHNATSSQASSDTSGESNFLTGVGIGALIALAVIGAFLILRFLKLRSNKATRTKAEREAPPVAPHKYSENDRQLLDIMLELDKLIKLT